MAFLASLVRYLVSYVILIAVAIGGLFFGKHLRDRKNQKTTQE